MQNGRQIFSRIVFVVALGCTIALFQNCGVVKQPGVDNATSKSVGFPHPPTLTSCSSCHANDKPTVVVGSLSLLNNLTPVGGLFDHSISTKDCASCHLAVPQNLGVTFRGGVFDHQPLPANCISCHTAVQRPTGAVGNPSYTHANDSTDCAKCHSAVPANVGKSWATAKFSHTPTPTTCVSCHLAQRPVGPIGNSAFNHANGGTGDCITCHTTPASNIGVTWTGGVIPHSPVPTSCNSCHQPDRPAVAKYPNVATPATGHYVTKDCHACHLPQSATVPVFRFDHSNALNQDIRFCLPCHQRDAHVGQDGSVAADAVGDGLCYQCHYTRRKSWSRGARDTTKFP